MAEQMKSENRKRLVVWLTLEQHAHLRRWRDELERREELQTEDVTLGNHHINMGTVIRFLVERGIEVGNPIS